MCERDALLVSCARACLCADSAACFGAHADLEGVGTCVSWWRILLFGTLRCAA